MLEFIAGAGVFAIGVLFGLAAGMPSRKREKDNT